MPTQGKESLPVRISTHRLVTHLKAETGKPMYVIVDEAVQDYQAKLTQLKPGNRPGKPENQAANPPPVEYNQAVHQRIEVILEKGDPKVRDALLGNIDAFYELVELRQEIDAREQREAPPPGRGPFTSSGGPEPQEISRPAARRKRTSRPEDRRAGGTGG